MPPDPPATERHGDRVAVVTGSTHGIGLGTAKRLAREGASVVVNDEGTGAGEAVAAGIVDRGGEAIFVPADATNPDAIERLIDRAVESFGRIDVLVNNVGGWEHDTADRTALSTWDDVMNATLRSHWLTTIGAIEHMPAGGSVVNISSVHAVQTDPGRFPYNVAKSGVNGLTRALALELGPEGIRVNAIMPGAIDTERADAADAELADSSRPEPIGRWGAPRDIAGVVSFLASDDAAFVTGATIPVDGGQTAVYDSADYAQWREDRS